MKRQRQAGKAKSRLKAKPAGTSPASVPAKKMSRRDMLGLLKFAAIGGAVVGGGGWYLVREVQAGIREADLSKIGNGVPAIVQVHDPQCPSCRALQGETRTALENFDAGEVQYLVANLNSPEGKALAREHGVGRVTLLLFDGQGRMRDMIQGRTSAEVLTAEFRRHLTLSRRRKAEG